MKDPADSALVYYVWQTSWQTAQKKIKAQGGQLFLGSLRLRGLLAGLFVGFSDS
jgi:hypothetical protein